MIVLVAPPALSLILISSPRMKVPDVSLNVIVVLLPPALFAKPVAPLANPSTNEVSVPYTHLTLPTKRIV